MTLVLFGSVIDAWAKKIPRFRGVSGFAGLRRHFRHLSGLSGPD
jgi:hypothetical protein